MKEYRESSEKDSREVTPKALVMMNAHTLSKEAEYRCTGRELPDMYTTNTRDRVLSATLIRSLSLTYFRTQHVLKETQALVISLLLLSLLWHSALRIQKQETNVLV